MFDTRSSSVASWPEVSARPGAFLLGPEGQTTEVFATDRMEEIRGMSGEAACRLVVCGLRNSVADVRTLLELMDEGIPLVAFNGSEVDRIQAAVELFRASHIYDARGFREMEDSSNGGVHVDRRVILPTSGTTSRPKFVSLSRSSLWTNARMVRGALGLADDERGITSLLPSYSFGISNLLVHLINGGSVVVTSAPVTSSAFWRQVVDLKVTSLAFVAASAAVVVRALRKTSSNTHIRRVMFAGGAVSPAILPALRSECRRLGIRLHLMYGQTEAGPRIAVSSEPASGDVSSANAPVGWPLSGVRVSIDPIDGNRGELLVTTPSAMSGYVRNRSELSSPSSVDQPMRTGDIASIAPDGQIRVYGRLDQQVKVMGHRLDLSEVAGLLEREFGRNAVAFSEPDKVIVVVEGKRPGAEMEQATVEFLESQTGLPSAYFRPTVVAVFPRKANGKLDLRLLERQVRSQSDERTED